MSARLLPGLGRGAFRFVRGVRAVNNALCGVAVVPRRLIIDTSYSAHFMDFTRSSIPSSTRKLVVTRLSPRFREAVSVQTVAVPTPGDAELLVRNRTSSAWHPEMEMMEKEMKEDGNCCIICVNHISSGSTVKAP